MSEPLQVIIRGDGVTLWHPKAKEALKLEEGEDVALGDRVAEFAAQRNVSLGGVIFFIAEDLLFYKEFSLPKQTVDVKEAVGFQLGLLAPFKEEENMLSSFITTREKDGILVTLVAAQRHYIEGYVQNIKAAGYKILGLFPESQRYVNKLNRKKKWALVVAGRFIKAHVFEGNRLADRVLCNVEPPFHELAAMCGTELIYHTRPEAEAPYRPAGELLGQKPNLKEFNLLPASLRRPELTKLFINALLVLNGIALLLFFGAQEYRLRNMEQKVEEEIRKLEPMVKEVRKLSTREKTLEKHIVDVEAIGPNPDLLPFLERFTAELPSNSYLDQMRLDKGQHTIQVQGFAAEMNELSAKLQQMGNAKLKSTSRRQNKTYFNLEVGLP